MRTLRIALAFYAQYLKSLLAFRWDFLFTLTGSVIGQILNVTMLAAIFSRIPHLQGWRFEQVLFVYGFAQMPINIFWLFAGSLVNINHLVIDGQLDQLLLRPVNPLLQVMTRELGYQQIPTIFTSLGLIAWAGMKMGVTWSWWQPLACAVYVLGGFLIYAGLAVAVGSLSFWYAERSGLIWAVLSVADFALYPVTIYDRPIRLILTWVLPFAFTAFFPASLLMGIHTYEAYAWATPLVGLLTFGLGYAAWRRGLQAYTSTGS